MNQKITMIISILTIVCIIGIVGCNQKNNELDTEKICTLDYTPVCGVDNVTYANTCTADSTPIAHQGECQIKEENNSTNAATTNTTTTTPTISEFCVSWFDGCNNCFITNGTIGGCTKKFCETVETPKCLEYKIPTNCTSWFDGCNNCGVESGNLTMCTLMYCETLQEPKCLQYE